MKKKDPTSHRIIEKRRRDRMNNCLADLSKLIPAHYMKKGRGRVEKTEIIEMAIKHLKDLIEISNAQQKQQQQHDQNPLISNNPNDHVKSPSPSSSSTSSLGSNVAPAGHHSATLIRNEDLQQFSDCQQQQHTSDYLNHHNHNQNHHHHASTRGSKAHRSSASSSSSNGSDSSSSSSSSSSCSGGGGSSSGRSCMSNGSMTSGSIGSIDSPGGSSSVGGCCTCGSKMLSASATSLSGAGNSLDFTSSSSECSQSNGSTRSPASCAWYKKAWLVRSFSRSPQR